MPTIHEEIDELLTADLHDQLTDSDRQTLHAHLVECADCRQLHKEYKNMNTALNETFEAAKPELAFEQRMLATFRKRVPDQGPGILRFLILAVRSRTAHVTAVLAVLLGLVQIGRLVTKEHFPLGDYASAAPSSQAQDEAEPRSATADGVIVTGSNIPTAEEVTPAEQPEKSNPPSSPAKKTGPSYATTNAADKYELPRLASGLAAKERLREVDIVRTPGRGFAASAQAERKSPIAAPEAPPSSVTADKSAAETSTSSSRKLIRNARTDLEVVSFQDTVEKITTLAREAHGYLATSGSQKQENGKLRGEVVVKVMPDALDHFLEQLRGLGELKNQTVGTEDVSRQYFDTTARLE